MIYASAFALSLKSVNLLIIGTVIYASASVCRKFVPRTCSGTIMHAAAFACHSFVLQDTGLTPIRANANAYLKIVRKASSGAVIYVNACAFRQLNACKVLSGMLKNALVSANPSSARSDSTSTALCANVFAFLNNALMGLPGALLNVRASAFQRTAKLASILI